MHTLLKREKSWANTPIQRLTPDATSRLFADIFRNGRTWTKKLGEEKREEKSKKRGGRGGGGGRMPFFWWMRSSPVTFGENTAVRSC